MNNVNFKIIINSLILTIFLCSLVFNIIGLSCDIVICRTIGVIGTGLGWIFLIIDSSLGDRNEF